MSDETVYVVRDAAGEYVRDFEGEKRTPASDEAYQFTDRDEAENARTRATDRVIAWDAE